MEMAYRTRSVYLSNFQGVFFCTIICINKIKIFVKFDIVILKNITHILSPLQFHIILNSAVAESSDHYKLIIPCLQDRYKLHQTKNRASLYKTKCKSTPQPYQRVYAYGISLNDCKFVIGRERLFSLLKDPISVTLSFYYTKQTERQKLTVF